jgi:hypothetical protein
MLRCWARGHIAHARSGGAVGVQTVTTFCVTSEHVVDTPAPILHTFGRQYLAARFQGADFKGAFHLAK